MLVISSYLNVTNDIILDIVRGSKKIKKLFVNEIRGWMSHN